MKIIKVKEQYYNLNHFGIFYVGNDYLEFERYLSGTFRRSSVSNYDEKEDDISLDNSQKFRFLKPTSNVEFMKQLDIFLNGNSNLMDCSSLIEIYTNEEAVGNSIEEENLYLDPQIWDVAKIIIEEQNCSASIIQTKLKLGYNRAGMIVDQLEQLGIIGPFAGSAAREVYFSSYRDLLNHLNAKGIKIVD